MSVIIRLQNLPWTANARDIRNFFTGLSIPEGGVHIIGGEMGDAFIAFSTDEDARCAMLKDREKLMEIQVRLLLSSRAEMQKVIETARLASTAAAAAAAAVATPAVAAVPKPAASMPPVPQPPIIGGLGGLMFDPQQGQIKQQQQIVPPVVVAAAAGMAAAPNFLAYQQQAGITLADVGGVGLKATTHDRHSPEQGYFSSRRRHSRSRSLSRSSSSDDSDRSRDRDPRYRSRKRRPDMRSDSSERELKLKPQAAAPAVPKIMPWASGVVPGAATAASVAVPGLGNMPGLQQQLSFMSVLPPVLQNYSSITNTTTNNYNLNAVVPPQQQQQFPIVPDVGVVVNKQVGGSIAAATAKQQEPIAFANVNPYAQIYPQLFEQQQQLLQQQTGKTASGMANSPGGNGGAIAAAAAAAGGMGAVGGSVALGSAGSKSLAGGAPVAETCYIKISGMCPTTSYSDLRKYFAGLYIPHNGIKIINGANGVRTGMAYIEFSRVSSAQKALSRNNTMFRDRLVQIAPVGDEEFEQAEELAQSSAAEHGNGRRGAGDERSSSGVGSKAGSSATVATADQPATCVLYVEDLPQLTTEQDIMKMFSDTYTIVDILLTPSPKNRRESVAYVLFARENEARSALEDTARHYIGFRNLRVHASNQLIMQAARDKMRRASEQLLKEEQQQREDAEREALQQQLQQQQQQLQLQLQLQQQQELLAMQNSDPRRRNNDAMQQQQQLQLQLQQKNNNNLQPFGNPGLHNGNMPFAFQQQQQQQQQNNINGMGMLNNNNNKIGPFGMPQNNNSNNNQQHMQQQQQQQQPHQGNPQRREDVFVRVHNCEYGTRVNDLGELFLSENLRIEHIEMLFNDRHQSAGEFIVEFCDTQSVDMAIRLFHNRRFRGRSLRIVTITPQEIADRMKKPFMDYMPRTNGSRQADDDADALPSQQQQQQQQQSPQQQQQQQSSRRRGPSRFDSDSNRNSSSNQQQQQQQSLPSPSNSIDNNNSSKQQQHFNPFAVRTGPELGLGDMASSSPMLGADNPKSNNNNDDINDGIPDKFNRPGCVVAMRNVPFKADLKDILRFFSDYKLSPDDIIRRFRDDGKPTGDARVAFESQSEARSAFESRRRKLIFNRSVVLEII